MADQKPPDDLGLSFFGDPEDSDEDPMYKEECAVQKSIKDLYEKMSGTGNPAEPITVDDLFKYLRIINFNFAALSKLIHAIYFRQSIIEEGQLELHKKMNTLTETNDLLDAALTPDEDENPDEKET